MNCPWCGAQGPSKLSRSWVSQVFIVSLIWAISFGFFVYAVHLGRDVFLHSHWLFAIFPNIILLLPASAALIAAWCMANNEQADWAWEHQRKGHGVSVSKLAHSQLEDYVQRGGG